MKAKKIASLLLAVLMLVSMLALPVAAESAATEMNFAEFNAAVRTAGTFSDAVTVVLKEAERSYQNGKAAQFFLGADTWNDGDAVETIVV